MCQRLISCSRQDLQGAIHKSDLLWEENKTRWPAHDPYTQPNSRVSIWDIFPKEVNEEAQATMAHD